ncbi:MAG: hypothetical protein ABIR33_09585 [Pyrinomonadaceae bacterium]
MVTVFKGRTTEVTEQEGRTEKKDSHADAPTFSETADATNAARNDPNAGAPERESDENSG